jgi:hypothetical protein
MDDRGSAGIVAIGVAAFLCICALGAIAYINGAVGYVRRVERERSIRLALYTAARSLLEALDEDESPESDGPRDPVWSRLGVGPDGVSLRLADVSSKLNPNLAPVDLLEKTDFRELFASGSSPEDLAEYRAEKGLSTRLEHYAAFFSEESSSELSCFGWANLNVDDRAALRALFLSLTGDEAGADAFSLRLEGERTAKRVITPESLEAFLGGSYGAVFPGICAEAPYNVNFASPELILSILSYPPFGIVDAPSRAAAIVAARESRNIGPIDLAALLGAAASRAVVQYFGTRTWFWEIGAESSGRSLRMTVAVWPGAAADGRRAKRLSIVETRFEP